MVFRVPTTTGQPVEGGVDYRLARQATLASYRSGELSRFDACDAHPELTRAAREVGAPTADGCPICEEADLVHVTYVFGPRLPKHGRCITLRGELARIGRRQGRFTAFVIEVCPDCSWNHLVHRFLVPKETSG